LTESYGKDAFIQVSRPLQGAADDLHLLTDDRSGGAQVISMIDWLDGLGRRNALNRRLEKINALREELTARQEGYRKAFFWTALLLFSCALTAVALNAMVQRKRHARRLRQQITTDLHDDLGSRMSAISLATTYLCKISGDPKVHERSGKIARIAREMQSSLSDVLWFTNSETDSLRQVIGKLMDLSELRIPPEQLLIEVTPPKQVPDFTVPVQLKRDLLLLFKEVVNNAAKHSEASEIRVKIKWKRPFLHIAVSDNGKGFVVEEEMVRQRKRPHLGLNSIQRRAQRLGAKLAIDSVLEQGTVVTLKVRP
jgi:signal transduction histidine kinase